MVKEIKMVKLGSVNKLSGRVESEKLDESCEALEFVLMKDGESIFRGDAQMSEVKGKLSKKSGKKPKRNFVLEIEIEEADNNCDAKYELASSIKCPNGDVVEGKVVDVTKHVKRVLECDGEYNANVNTNSNNNTLVESVKKNEKKLLQQKFKLIILIKMNKTMETTLS